MRLNLDVRFVGVSQLTVVAGRNANVETVSFTVSVPAHILPSQATISTITEIMFTHTDQQGVLTRLSDYPGPYPVRRCTHDRNTYLFSCAVTLPAGATPVDDRPTRRAAHAGLETAVDMLTAEASAAAVGSMLEMLREAYTGGFSLPLPVSTDQGGDEGQIIVNAKQDRLRLQLRDGSYIEASLQDIMKALLDPDQPRRVVNTEPVTVTRRTRRRAVKGVD